LAQNGGLEVDFICVSCTFTDLNLLTFEVRALHACCHQL